MRNISAYLLTYAPRYVCTHRAGSMYGPLGRVQVRGKILHDRVFRLIHRSLVSMGGVCPASYRGKPFDDTRCSRSSQFLDGISSLFTTRYRQFHVTQPG